MARKHKRRPNPNRKAQPASPPRGKVKTVAVVCGAVALGAAILFALLGPACSTNTKPAAKSQSSAESKTPEAAKPAAEPAAPAGDAARPAEKPRAAAPDAKVLKGRWRRINEAYTLEIRQVDSDGKLEAAYFNPGPIRVSKAEVSQRDGALLVFVELRDPEHGYPGCTYKLRYEAKDDVLAGEYFQAARGETHDVAFVREPQR